MTRRAAVIVLGDLGHSPRMQYHCLSLLKQGFSVEFIGYAGSPPHESLLASPKLTLRHLSEPPPLPGVVGRLLKLFWQFFTLLYCLFLSVKKLDLILLQNPPGLPAMLVSYLSAKCIHNCRFIIDWHNYTFSVFGLNYNPNGCLVKLVECYEFRIGKLANGGLCVTDAMRIDLEKRGVTNVLTHYDRPSEIFKPFSKQDRMKYLRVLCDAMDEFTCLVPPLQKPNCAHPEKNFNAVMLISSTSWTADENFDILFKALKIYDNAIIDNEVQNLPKILMVITGKGPMKSYYLDVAAKKNFHNVTIVTPWLKAEDYPNVLACADLGISLHYSSSGLDFPMKIVDMQGCGLPVLSMDFACATEIVKPNENGYLFNTSDELFQLLVKLLTDGSENKCLTELRSKCLDRRSTATNWDAAWNSRVFPYISRTSRVS